MKVLLLDNYDSFTFNLVHILRELEVSFDVFKHDEIAIKEINDYDKIIISPGPGLPIETGRLLHIIKQYTDLKPMLGICLGHQAIAEHFGGKLERMKYVRHGISSQLQEIEVTQLYFHIEGDISVGKYHSWCVSDDGFPDDLVITSRDEEGSIMSFEHKTLPIFGVQFHPESILTPRGKEMIANFVLN